MIEIVYQLKRDLDNTVEIKSFTKKFDTEMISKEELYQAFEHFISEYINADNNE